MLLEGRIGKSGPHIDGLTIRTRPTTRSRKTENPQCRACSNHRTNENEGNG